MTKPGENPVKSSMDAGDDFIPPLPPQMQSLQSVDEVVKMMNKTPLFMTSLDNVDDGLFKSTSMHEKLSNGIDQRRISALRQCERYSMRVHH